ncbi:MAG: hypothetical protein DME52_13735 [Verrucomicrobia bacterium]|nr:MAG: hypothetical protein DME52_13735 [Verrucomicrobiota bacterium]
MENFRQIMDIVGTSVDGVGVFIVVGGALFATVRLVLRRMQGAGNYYVWYRQDVVLIRTFLSLSLQLEIEGRLPWRREVPLQAQDH